MSCRDTYTSSIAPTSKQLAQSLALRLLQCPELMTPRMTVTFGPVKAERIALDSYDNKLLRTSRLVSVATGAAILEAKLCIIPTALPQALMASLRETNVLFGQLLLDHQVLVDVAVPALFQTNSGCYGRQTTMTEVATGNKICDVIETMSSDAILDAIEADHAARQARE